MAAISQAIKDEILRKMAKKLIIFNTSCSLMKLLSCNSYQGSTPANNNETTFQPNFLLPLLTEMFLSKISDCERLGDLDLKLHRRLCHGANFHNILWPFLYLA